MRFASAHAGRIALAVAIGLCAGIAPGNALADESFDAARAAASERLERSLQELGTTRDRIAKEKIPLSRAVSALALAAGAVAGPYDEYLRFTDFKSAHSVRSKWARLTGADAIVQVGPD